MVARAAHSFHSHSAAGPSALRPAHLKPAVQSAAHSVEHLTAVVALLSHGARALELVLFLCGAALVAPKGVVLVVSGIQRRVLLAVAVLSRSAAFLPSRRSRRQAAGGEELL